MTAEQRVRELAGPIAGARGLDLITVEVKGSGGSRLVRVVVDRKGGVSIGDCQELSRALEHLLDAEDPIDGRYALEVTSPGTDRSMHDQAAFDRAEGRGVLVVCAEAEGERTREVRGVVVAAEPDAVVLDAEGDEVRVPYSEIVKAKQTLPW